MGDKEISDMDVSIDLSEDSLTDATNETQHTNEESQDSSVQNKHRAIVK